MSFYILQYSTLYCIVLYSIMSIFVEMYIHVYINIYTYHIAIDTVSICIYVYVYLYILSGKICYIFLILTEILKRNPSTPTTGERKVVGQFQVFVGSQFDAGNIAMS